MGPRSHARPRPTAAFALGALAAGLLVGAALGALWGIAQPPSYPAVATLMVALPVSQEGADEVDILKGRARLAPSFATIAVTPDAVHRIAAQLGIEDEAASILAHANARSEEGSSELTITARYRDPDVAAELANGLAADLIARAGGADTGALVSIGKAQPAARAETPTDALAAAIGGVVGLVLAASVLLVRTSRRPEDDAAELTAQPSEPGAGAAQRPPGFLIGAGLAVALLGVMAFGLPGQVALGFAALIVGAAAVMPAAGFAALIMLMPHNEPEILGAIGIKLPVLLALGYGLVIRALAERRIPRIGLGFIAMAGLLGIAFVSAVPAINGLAGDRAVASAARFLQFADGLILLVIAALYFVRRDPRPFLVLALVSVTLASMMAVLQILAGDGQIPLITGLYTGGQGQALVRVTGPFQNPNYFGLCAGLGVVLALGIAVELPRSRRLALLCLPILGVALLATLSRGALAAAGVGVLVWLWYRNRQLATIAAVAAVVVGLVITPLVVGARLGSPTASEAAAAQEGLTESDEQRLESVAAGTQLFLLDPVLGVGFGQYDYVSPRFVGNSFATSAHNQYLKILAEQGLVGTAFYVAAVVALLVAMRRSASPWRPTAIAMLAVYGVSGLFLEPLTTFQTSGVLWLVLGIVVAGPPVVRAALVDETVDFSQRFARVIPSEPAAV